MIDEFRLLDENEGKSAEINMGPLMDMVFILLIFFVITAQFSEQTGLEINKPTASTAKVTIREPTIISITANDDIHIHGRRVTEGTLKTILMREKKSSEELAVLITGDKKSSLDVVVKIMDICGTVGIKKVSVGAEKR